MQTILLQLKTNLITMIDGWRTRGDVKGLEIKCHLGVKLRLIWYNFKFFEWMTFEKYCSIQSKLYLWSRNKARLVVLEPSCLFHLYLFIYFFLHFILFYFYSLFFLFCFISFIYLFFFGQAHYTTPIPFDPLRLCDHSCMFHFKSWGLPSLCSPVL